MFHIETVHGDWYEDGVEFLHKTGVGENLWRLDFAVGDNAYQAQLFAAVAVGEEEFDANYDHRGTKAERAEKQRSRPCPYKSARLFIERDNRIPGGDGERIDYACGAWPLTPGEATHLLTLPEADAVAAMLDKVRQVESLPNDRKFIIETAHPTRVATIQAYWAKEDAK